jgi:shikimate kinase
VSSPGRFDAQRHIVLIGYRGTGKTTVGRALAGRLRRPFIDTDELIEQAAGRSVAEIFRHEGEPAFRMREAHTLERALSLSPAVISAGGGAILSENNRSRLAQLGCCVWLRAEPDELLARLSADARTAALRPALTGKPPEEEIRELLARRSPLYERLATFSVQTDNRSIDSIVDEIVLRLPVNRVDDVQEPPA